MQFVFVYQREPHARQMAFAEIPQPKDLGERCELARKTCDELVLDPALVWIDGMDDQSRALFGDLPSPAIVVDPFGVVRTKLPWAEPDALGPQVESLLAKVGQQAERTLIFGDGAELAGDPGPEYVGAALYVARRDGKLPDESTRRPFAVWAAALGAPPAAEGAAVLPDSWLGLTACATLVAERRDDARWRGWIDRLLANSSVPVRHWAQQQLVQHLRRSDDADATARAERQLAELRQANPWLVAPAR
ncbi:MAG: hypothetical protein H6838_01275 [Planctomycetes bacterium]|nr:hypothetical protein [Planctomycetota bacterium]MCB9884088.1 hypothetical protein [Planctomycetota bacterium]